MVVDFTLASHPIADKIDQNAPEELKSLPQWVLWKYQYIPGRDKPKKPPFQANGYRAAVDDPHTWSSYQQVKATLEAGGDYQGLGMVLDGGIVAIDLDDCLREVNGIRRITNTARQIYDIAQSYTEVSPSGKGLHIFLKGTLPEENGKPILGMKHGKGEMYVGKRYITITGDIVGEQRDIRADQEAINQIYALLKPPKQQPLPTLAPTRHFRFTTLDDEKVKQLAENASNGAKFKRLYYHGDTTLYTSSSEAHLALVALLAHRTKDTGQIERIFKTSCLYLNDEKVQVKWEEKHYANGKTYGQRTIEKALESSISFKR